jgi:hypothetical protein
LPLGGPADRAARSFGASLEGGLFEFDELSPNRRRSSAFSALSAAFSVSNAGDLGEQRFDQLCQALALLVGGAHRYIRSRRRSRG